MNTSVTAQLGSNLAQGEPVAWLVGWFRATGDAGSNVYVNEDDARRAAKNLKAYAGAQTVDVLPLYAHVPSGQMSIGEIQSRSYEHGYSDGVEWCTKQLESRAPSPSATEEMENYRMALAYISRQSTDPESRELAETALGAYPSTERA